MPSRAVRDHSPQPRRSSRQRKVPNAFAIPEADEELIEQRARREPAAEEPAVDEEKCAQTVAEEGSTLHEFLFVCLLMTMLAATFATAIMFPAHDFVDRAADPPPVQTPSWLAWIAPVLQT